MTVSAIEQWLPPVDEYPWQFTDLFQPSISFFFRLLRSIFLLQKSCYRLSTFLSDGKFHSWCSSLISKVLFTPMVWHTISERWCECPKCDWTWSGPFHWTEPYRESVRADLTYHPMSTIGRVYFHNISYFEDWAHSVIVLEMLLLIQLAMKNMFHVCSLV